MQLTKTPLLFCNCNAAYRAKAMGCGAVTPRAKPVDPGGQSVSGFSGFVRAQRSERLEVLDDREQDFG